jgi:uncharacterized metal-binding protein
MILLITCSGVSNTGRLTTQTAHFLLSKDPGRIIWVPAQKSPEDLRDMAGNAEEVIILNGCTDCCATRKLQDTGFSDGSELTITDLGIKKNGMAEVRFSEIEIVAGAVIKIMQREKERFRHEG